MYALSVVFTVKPEHIEDFKKAALTQAKNSRTNEKDCLDFAVYQAEDNPAVFYFHEVYTSKKALEDVHYTTPYFAEYQKTVAPWIAEREAKRWVSSAL